MLPAVSASDPLVLELNGRRLENGAFETRLSMGDWSRTAEDDCYAWSSQWEIGHERLPADVLDAWKGIQGIVRDRVRQHDGIELRITGEREGVAWRHVVRVFDDLLGAGLREVALPGLGARLVLAEPEDTSHAPYVFPDDPVVTPLVAFLATLMVLAAFALAFLPLRIGRSARKRPRRP